MLGIDGLALARRSADRGAERRRASARRAGSARPGGSADHGRRPSSTGMSRRLRSRPSGPCGAPRYFYVANSQWEAYDDAGRLRAGAPAGIAPHSRAHASLGPARLSAGQSRQNGEILPSHLGTAPATISDRERNTVSGCLRVLATSAAVVLVSRSPSPRSSVPRPRRSSPPICATRSHSTPPVPLAATFAGRDGFDVRAPAPVLLSLPAWTPGAYELSNYARKVSDFSARSAAVAR